MNSAAFARAGHRKDCHWRTTPLQGPGYERKRKNEAMLFVARFVRPGRALGRALSTASAVEASEERVNIFNPSEEHLALRQMVRSFAEGEVDPQRADYNGREAFNRPLFARCGELGLLGVTADPACGGSGMDAVAACIVHEELSAADPAFALSYLAHSMLYVNNVSLNASEAQKARWLPGACDGSKVCAMAMSEPDAGTDVLGMRTTAVDAGDHYVLNGAKMWITNGCVDDATLGDGAIVYARTGPGRADVSLFHVSPETPGFSLGQRVTGKLGMRASPTAELVFEDAVVPKEDLVSEWNGASLCMMRNLELERVVLAAMAVGIAKRCVDRMAKYAHDRAAFGKPIADFGQVQRYVAEAYAKLMAARAYLYAAARVRAKRATTTFESFPSPGTPTKGASSPKPARRRRRPSTSTSPPLATASTPTASSSSPRPSPKTSPTPPSRSTAATATSPSTRSSSSGATRNSSRSAAGPSNRTTRT